MSSALIGRTALPVISHSRTSVVVTRMAKAIGRPATIAAWPSAKSAALPPTSTANGADRPRMDFTAVCAVSPRGEPGTTASIRHVAASRRWGADTEATPSTPATPAAYRSTATRALAGAWTAMTTGSELSCG